MHDPRGAGAVPSRARQPTVGRRAFMGSATVLGAWVLTGRPGLDPGGSVTPAAGASDEAGPVPAGGRVTPEVVAAAPALRPLGRVGDLGLAVPADQVVLVAWHEASKVEALAVEPVGTLRTNGNPTRFEPPEDDPAGPVYDIQVSRGRAPGPTTACDVVLRDDQPVRSPVACTVADVRRYDLYGRHPDVRLELRPDDAPGLAVVLIHLEDVDVAAGDRLAAGDVLARRARRFPFSSIVDAATEPERYGHVHIEVKQA